MTVGASYDALASEYYDRERHPTCANFRDASLIIARTLLTTIESPEGLWCDVGAGDSVLADAMKHLHVVSPNGAVALDESVGMLAHTKTSKLRFVQRVVGRVESLPLRDDSVGLLLAALGDPYNRFAFWQEAARVVRVGGYVCFTTPSFAWAHQFRTGIEHTAQDKAMFLLKSGEHIAVDSFVLKPTEQISMAARVGLRLLRTLIVDREQLPPPLSTKLTSIQEVVTGYVFLRDQGDV